MKRLPPELWIASALAACTLLVWPFGEYLVDDEWAYVRSLHTLWSEGRVRILDWNPMSLVVHLAWGWLFVAPVGFSFTAAKLSTVALAFVECAALTTILRRMGVHPATAALAGLALLVHPVHFFQTFLYATDVPALAWSTLAFGAYARGLERQAPLRYLWLGSVFCALAFGVRQGGLLVAGAVGLHLLVHERARLRSPGVWAAAFAVPVAAVVGFELWYLLDHGPTRAFEQSLERSLAFLAGTNADRAAYVGYTLLAYTALPLLPLAAALPARDLRPGRDPRRRLGAAAAVLAATAAFAWVSVGRERSFPYIHNKITRFGFLSPNEVIAGARDVLWGDAVAWSVSLALFAAGVILLLRWIAPPHPRPEAPAEGAGGDARGTGLRLAGLWLALQGAYSLATFGIAFDRHLLALAPATLVLFVGGLPPGRRLSSVRFGLIAAPLAAYAIAGTHDVHAFSRAAFAAGRELMARGIPAAEIEAGYAFDGWHMYAPSPAGAAVPHRGRRGPGPRQGDAWYVHGVTPGVRSRYLVSLSRGEEPERFEHGLAYWMHRYRRPPLAAYRVLHRSSYRSYWPWRRAPLFVLLDERLGPLAPHGSGPQGAGPARSRVRQASSDRAGGSSTRQLGVAAVPAERAGRVVLGQEIAHQGVRGAEHQLQAVGSDAAVGVRALGDARKRTLECALLGEAESV